MIVIPPPGQRRVTKMIKSKSPFKSEVVFVSTTGKRL